jgi:glycosyltransferase involved in cell wall biosynthesis
MSLAVDSGILKPAEKKSAVVATIIVPAYNEEAGIGFVLESLFKAVGGKCEVFVVDDGSNDATSTIASAFPCGVIRHRENRGKGEAMRTGLGYASGEYVIFIDADGTYPASFIPQMIDALDSSDVVYCSRRRGRANIPFLNRVGHRIFHNTIRCVYGFQGRDYCTGLYGIRRRHLDKMDIVSPGFAIEPEIAIKASRMKLKMQDIPIQYLPRRGKTKLGSFKAGWEHLKTIFGLLSWQPAAEGRDLTEGAGLPSDRRAALTSGNSAIQIRGHACAVVTTDETCFIGDAARAESEEGK